MYKFLILRPDRIGDAIITQVIIEALFKSVKCEIDVFASEYNHLFFKDNPFINQLFYCEIENKKNLIKYYKNNCVAKIYDAIFILQSRKRIQKLALMNNCKYRIALDLIYDKSNIIKIYKFYMQRIKGFSFVEYNLNQHEVISLQNVINCGLKKLSLSKIINLPNSCYLYNSLIKTSSTIKDSIVINFTGKKEDQRNILISQLNYILEYVIDNGFSQIAIISDSSNIEELTIYLTSKYQNYKNKFHIYCEQDIFIIINLIKCYEYFISCDGGLLHIAAAIKLKCVGLFNQNMINRWYPWTQYQVSISNINGVYAISPEEIIQGLLKLKNL